MTTLRVDPDGVVRFKANRIVRDLVDACHVGTMLDLNEISRRAQNGSYTLDEWQELYQLMGYSLEGFLEIFDDERLRGLTLELARSSPRGQREVVALDAMVSRRVGGDDAIYCGNDEYGESRGVIYVPETYLKHGERVKLVVVREVGE